MLCYGDPLAARLRRITVVRQDLRGAAEGASEGFVEGNTAKLPSVRPALPLHLPVCGPSELVIVPHQPPE